MHTCRVIDGAGDAEDPVAKQAWVARRRENNLPWPLRWTPSRGTVIWGVYVGLIWLMSILIRKAIRVAAPAPAFNDIGLRFHNSFVNQGREPPPFSPATPRKHPSTWTPPSHGLPLQHGAGWGVRVPDAEVRRAEDLSRAWTGMADRRIPRYIFATSRDYIIMDVEYTARWLESCMDINPGWQVRGPGMRRGSDPDCRDRGASNAAVGAACASVVDVAQVCASAPP